jgi:hypothetical protein
MKDNLPGLSTRGTARKFLNNRFSIKFPGCLPKSIVKCRRRCCVPITLNTGFVECLINWFREAQFRGAVSPGNVSECHVHSECQVTFANENGIGVRERDGRIRNAIAYWDRVRVVTVLGEFSAL